MRRSLIAYLVYGGSLVALYGIGGFSGWWKGIRLLPRTSYGGYGPSGGSGHGGSSWGTGGGSSGGGFRGGK